MLFCMVIWSKRYTWSNLRSMLFWRRIKSVISGKQYMDSSRVHERDLRSLASPSRIDFHRCHSDHSVFFWPTKSGLVVLAVYVDDILLTGSDSACLVKKEYLRHYFVIKDMGKPKHFLGIEVEHQNTVYSFLNRSMLWIFWRRQDFWDANLPALQ